MAVCTDLFFVVKIQDAAKRAGLELKCYKTRESAMDAARNGVRMVVLDLNCREVDCVDLARSLKAHPATAAIPQVAFLSHVQADLARAAQQAGCDRVMARSAFSNGVVQIMAALGAEPDNASLPVGIA